MFQYQAVGYCCSRRTWQLRPLHSPDRVLRFRQTQDNCTRIGSNTWLLCQCCETSIHDYQTPDRSVQWLPLVYYRLDGSSNLVCGGTCAECKMLQSSCTAAWNPVWQHHILALIDHKPIDGVYKNEAAREKYVGTPNGGATWKCAPKYMRISQLLVSTSTTFRFDVPFGRDSLAVCDLYLTVQYSRACREYNQVCTGQHNQWSWQLHSK